MTVKELIVALLSVPMDAPVSIDTDDGLTGNYHEIQGVRAKTNMMGKPYVVIDSDFLPSVQSPTS